MGVEVGERTRDNGRLEQMESEESRGTMFKKFFASAEKDEVWINKKNSGGKENFCKVRPLFFERNIGKIFLMG